jgi:hypothetical protein
MKKFSKAHYDRYVHPHTFSEGDLVLAYDVFNETLGLGKLESIWWAPFIIKHYLTKGAYVLSFLEGDLLRGPVIGLYLKRFYP